MSGSFQNIKNIFNEYICIYTGLTIPTKNIDERTLIPTINRIAYDNKDHYIELSKIIIDHLEKDDLKYKMRLFHIIDSLFKNVGKYFIESLSQKILKSFKECFTYSDKEDRILLFRIYYTWKYILPKKVTETIRIDCKMDDFEQIVMKDFPQEIKNCDEFNEAQRKKIINNSNNNLNIKKEFKEDKCPKSINNGQINFSNKTTGNKPINVEKKNNQNLKTLMGKKRKAIQEKTSDTNSATKKKKKLNNKIKVQNNNTSNSINLHSNITPKTVPMTTNINISQNTIIPGNKMNNTTNNIQFMNNNNPNIISNVINQSQDQQQPLQTLINFLRNNQLNLINFPFFPNPQPGVSQIEINIFKFIFTSNVKLSENLRFFSSLAKFFNESVYNENLININCKYEDIYKNQEYQQIHQKQNNLLFNNIKKNLCTICGFRTLYYNKLTEHLDIHFNINYLKKEGKNLFRKKGNNRNNWITGDNNNNNKIKDNRKNEIGYTLGNLLYYKNMMNNNLIKNNNEGQEEGNEELMYPIDDNNIRCCEFCGDEFKKIFSNKYNYWFYSDIVKVREEKIKLLVHKTCYEEMIKKI